MLLSIITVNYNNLVGLSNTVESVLSQSNIEFEYIIIDGGSSDGSADYLVLHAHKFSYWVSEKDKGIYDAMNKGIARATGKYLMFLNSGDLLADNTVLEKCSTELLVNDKVDIFYGDIVVSNHPNPHYKLHIYPDKVDIKFFKNDTINHQASLIRHKLFQEFGCYPINYKLASDYWLFLQSCLHQKTFCHIKSNLVIYDFSGISSLNDYTHYKNEKDVIWNSIVPDIINNIVCENEMLIVELQKLKRLTSYKIVKMAIKFNLYYQKLKF